MLYFIVSIVIGLIVTLILSFVFKNASKVDRGVGFNYFKLSYRRKMIRTLASLPIMILLSIVIYSYTDWSMLANILVGLFFVLTFSIQLIYNFNMWKKNEA
ncbi:hypothetical protein [Peribacillus loiseleuriae]|uniref:hypothetical protein n=1 Tax=Peribacillus loiseleuriae TaxID=1679170 RepID=UPI003CFEAF7C